MNDYVLMRKSKQDTAEANQKSNILAIEEKAKRKKEDEEWRSKRKESKEQVNIVITSLVAVLVIIDNCTRKCFGLPVLIKGRRVTDDDVIRALEVRLPQELKYIISDNGKQFICV